MSLLLHLVLTTAPWHRCHCPHSRWRSRFCSQIHTARKWQIGIWLTRRLCSFLFLSSESYFLKNLGEMQWKIGLDSYSTLTLTKVTILFALGFKFLEFYKGIPETIPEIQLGSRLNMLGGILNKQKNLFQIFDNHLYFKNIFPLLSC